MMRDFLKHLLLVNAPIAVAFLLFEQLVRLCLACDVSPWCAAVVFVGAFLIFCWRTLRAGRQS